MAEQLIFDWGRTAPPRFDNFLAGSNGEVVAHLRALAAGKIDETSILVWGQPGSGKSHLTSAVVAEAGSAARVVACDDDNIVLPETIAPRTLFAIEAVDTLSPGAQARLFTLYNACRANDARMLMTSRVPPSQAPLRDDLRTRIGWGLVLELKPLIDADKPAALAAYAQSHGFRLGPEVIAFLLTHVRRDMGTLLSMLRALDRHSLSTKRPVTIPMVRELLQPEMMFEPRAAGSVEGNILDERR